MLPITLSIVLRQQTDSQRGQAQSLMRMLHIAHGALIEAIDRYDPSVAHPFESVLTNRLMQVLAKPSSGNSDISASDLIDQLEAAGLER